GSEILLRNLATHLDFTTAGETEEGISTGAGRLPNLRLACENDPIRRCYYSGSREPRLRLRKHRSRYLHARIVSYRCRAAFLDVFSRERSSGFDAFGAPIFRCGQCGLRARLVERSGEPVHLRLQDGGVE